MGSNDIVHDVWQGPTNSPLMLVLYYCKLFTGEMLTFKIGDGKFSSIFFPLIFRWYGCFAIICFVLMLPFTFSPQPTTLKLTWLMWCFLCVCVFQQLKDSDFDEMEAWLNEQVSNVCYQWPQQQSEAVISCFVLPSI